MKCCVLFQTMTSTKLSRTGTAKSKVNTLLSVTWNLSLIHISEDGIHLSHGKTARYDKSAQVISWESAAERIGEMCIRDRNSIEKKLHTPVREEWEDEDDETCDC